MAASRFRQARGNRLLEQSEVLIVGSIQTFLFHEFPQPLNEMKVG